jgi:hypothetical protein
MNYANHSKGKAMSLFPMFLKLEGRSCLVVGAGKIGESKIRSLLAAHATVRVVAPSATSAVSEWARAGIVTWVAREFDLSDLDATFLVVAAASAIEVMTRSTAKHSGARFYAMSSMIPSVVISIIRPWFAVGLCRLRSRQAARARRSRKGSVVNSKGGWRLSMRAGSRNWGKRAQNCFALHWRPNIGDISFIS